MGTQLLTNFSNTDRGLYPVSELPSQPIPLDMRLQPRAGAVCLAHSEHQDVTEVVDEVPTQISHLKL